MEFRTIVAVEGADFAIEPCEELLFVGSCFADNIGQRFHNEGFPVTVNPFGTMYNPASVLHTLERIAPDGGRPWPRIVFITLGTNHVYRLRETGEIVDNCEKRPQHLFQEERLTVDTCADYLRRAVALLQSRRPDVHVVFTVSPIRYRKYGYHESQLSKATLLLAVERVTSLTSQTSLTSSTSPTSPTSYFPAYELIMDELRDYRFYAPDMLHPSQQAVDYLWERLVDSYFSPAAKTYLQEWQPLRQALSHKPFHPDSEEYRHFLEATHQRLSVFMTHYPGFVNPINHPLNPYE